VTIPISYLELNSPDLRSTARFFEDVFSWELQPRSLTTSSFLTAPHRALTAGCCPRATAPRERFRSSAWTRSTPSVRSSRPPVARLSLNRSASPAWGGAVTAPIRPGCCSDCTNTSPRSDNVSAITPSRGAPRGGDAFPISSRGRRPARKTLHRIAGRRREEHLPPLLGGKGARGVKWRSRGTFPRIPGAGRVPADLGHDRAPRIDPTPRTHATQAPSAHPHRKTPTHAIGCSRAGTRYG
jgi:hypothetical protein